MLMMVYTKSLITYSQKNVAPNSCSFIAILTNLSNLTWIKMTYPAIKEWYSALRTEWSWALVTTERVRRVMEWFNSYYKRKIKMNMLTVSTSLRHAKIGKMIYIWFRRNRESAYDFQVDGVVNKVPSWQMEWWHSCNLIRDGEDYIIVDNYEWERQYNTYKVSESILKLMISKQIIRWTAYIFSEGA